MKVKKIIEYGLYLLVFLLPIQTRLIIRAGEINGGYFEYGTISLYGTDILLVLLLLLATLLVLSERFQYSISNIQYPINIQLSIFKYNFYWLAIGFLDLLIFIAIFYSPDKLVALQKYFWFLLGAGLFWLIVSADYNKLKLVYWFLAGVLLQAILGIWQFFSQSSFAFKWLGMASHNPGDLGVSVIEILSGGRWLRAYGGLDHPNILGGLLVVGVLAVLLLLIQEAKTQDTKTRIKFVCILYLVSCILVIALFFTFSRAAWAGLIIGILVFFSVTLKKRDLFAQKNLLKLLGFFAIVAVILSLNYQDLLLTRLSRDTRLEIKSNEERIASYYGAKDMISHNLFFGIGAANYTQQLYKINPHLKSWDYQPVHNVFLLIWAEIGIFGLILFLLIFFAIGRILWKRNQTGDKLEFYKISWLAAMFVMFIIDHWWWSGHFGSLLFWLTAGLVIKKETD